MVTVKYLNSKEKLTIPVAGERLKVSYSIGDDEVTYIFVANIKQCLTYSIKTLTYGSRSRLWTILRRRSRQSDG